MTPEQQQAAIEKAKQSLHIDRHLEGTYPSVDGASFTCEYHEDWRSWWIWYDVISLTGVERKGQPA